MPVSETIPRIYNIETVSFHTHRTWGKEKQKGKRDLSPWSDSSSTKPKNYTNTTIDWSRFAQTECPAKKQNKNKYRGIYYEATTCKSQIKKNYFRGRPDKNERISSERLFCCSSNRFKDSYQKNKETNKHKTRPIKFTSTTINHDIEQYRQKRKERERNRERERHVINHPKIRKARKFSPSFFSAERKHRTRSTWVSLERESFRWNSSSSWVTSFGTVVRTNICPSGRYTAFSDERDSISVSVSAAALFARSRIWYCIRLCSNCFETRSMRSRSSPKCYPNTDTHTHTQRNENRITHDPRPLSPLTHTQTNKKRWVRRNRYKNSSNGIEERKEEETRGKKLPRPDLRGS